MPLFNINQNEHLEIIKEVPFKLEKEIQTLTEKNLKIIFGLELVCTEFSVGNFRIDTLAYDKESSSFVIIEYKRDKNFSVIDQGYAYLSLMLNNKSDFILEYNENSKINLKRKDVDWSQSKILFVAPSFTTYQKEAINFKDLPIELWEVKRYSNKTVSYNQIRTSGAKESIKTVSKFDSEMEIVSKEIKIYTEQEHIDKGSEEIKELYKKLRNAILNLDELEIKPKKLYVSFAATSNIVDVNIQQSQLKIWINLRKGELDDPKQICRDVSTTGHWGNGDYEISMKTDENLEYILSLVKQSIKNKNS